jgi:tRNA pseudouridine55 synthase
LKLPVPAKYEEGQVLLVNKPLRWTSFDAVKRIRGNIGIKKVGHAGTLDPLATGLLIICTGKFTKKLNDYMAEEKEYTGSFILGATTPTYDLESEPEDFKPYDFVTPELLQEATFPFTGEIMQLPPAHSAIKKDGVRLYEMARKGVEVKLEPRKVHIKEFTITRVELPEVFFKVVCGTGTYIRSLAKDYGEALGCGAYLGSLCRTRIGAFTIAQAQTIDEILAQISEERTALKGHTNT